MQLQETTVPIQCTITQFTQSATSNHNNTNSLASSIPQASPQNLDILRAVSTHPGP